MAMPEYRFQLEVPGGCLSGREWPVEHSRASVAIAHGINEHIGRYTHVAEALASAGYTVAGVDHLGHGLSAAGGQRTSNIRRFDTFVNDFLVLIDRLRTERPEPVVALGHSMGGLIATRAALRAQDRLSALVLSGPALKLPMHLTPFRLRIALEVARLVPFLPAPTSVNDGLSRDPGVRERFRADPLCIHQSVRMGIARQIYLLSEETRPRAHDMLLPLLVMHGAADQITDPEGSREFVANASSPDKEFVLWPEDEHEIFNELDQQAVISRMINWLDLRFVASGVR